MPSHARLLLPGLLACLAANALNAQVHYHPDGRPWNQRAHSGPDAECDGWYYNLGITGLRVELVAEQPTHLVVRHVIDGTPAKNKVRVGDHIVGAGGAPFVTPHRNGYGMQVFGPEGPMLDFANALEAATSDAGNGRLVLQLQRDGKPVEASLKLGKQHGTYSATFPAACQKSERQLERLLDYLVAEQKADGSWGSPPRDMFAPLALLASGERKFRQAVEKCVRFHARTTSAQDHSSLINWRYMAAGIVMAEYYLATGEKWLLPELQEVHDFLMHSQYTDIAQLDARSRQSHPHSVPTKPGQAEGGWGHNPGFEGYGPIAMITGQGALTLALLHRCGIGVDRARHDSAYEFCARGTGRNGYLWYGDQAASQTDYADMGRTGAAGIANWLSPYSEPRYRERALLHAKCIGDHPLSFPDTHGSPPMGMVFAALAANVDAQSFRRLMDQNRWWFTLAECPDGSFYYQPNRDNAGYGPDSRLKPSAVVALILSIPKQSLHLTGKPFVR